MSEFVYRRGKDIVDPPDDRYAGKEAHYLSPLRDCGERYDGFECTLNETHLGLHVAHGVDNNAFAQWGNEEYNA